MYPSSKTGSENPPMQYDQYTGPSLSHADFTRQQGSPASNAIARDPQQYNSNGYHSQGPFPSRLPPPYEESMHPYNTSAQQASLPFRVPAPAPAASQPSVKPIVIPATTATLGSPFLRAYPPSLASRDISRELFLKFLDDLNRVAVKSPPLQVLGLAGTVVSFVPLQTTQIVGGAINAAADIGTFAVSKGRTEMFLKDANRTIFAPRGLKAALGKIEAVASLAGIPGVLNAQGKIDKKSSILPALEETEGGAPTVSGQQRRMKWLEPYTQYLEVDPLPQIEKPGNVFSQLSVKASEGERKKGEKKMIKERGKVREKYAEDSQKAQEDFDKEMRKLDKEEEKVRRKERKKLDEELAKIEKERRKVRKEYEEEMRKVEKDTVKDDVEEKALRKVLWLIISELDSA